MILTPYLIPLLLSTLILCGLGVASLRLHRSVVVAPFSALMFFPAGWALIYFLEIATPDPVIKILWSKVVFAAIAPIPVALLLLVLAFVGYTRLVDRRTLVILSIVPALTIVLALVSPPLALFRTQYQVVQNGPFPVVTFINGPWYWVHVIYTYGIGLVALTVLATAGRRIHKYFMQQTLILALAVILPSLVDFLFEIKLTPIAYYNITPSVFVLTGLLLFFTFFRYRALDVIPIARGRVFESITDLVLIVDPSDRLVDYNPAAEQILGNRRVQIGAPLAAVLKGWPQFFDLYQPAAACGGHCAVELNGSTAYYEFSASPIPDPLGKPTGALIIFHDVTVSTASKDALRQSEQRYRMLAENGTDAIWMLDLDTCRYTYISPAITRLRGYTPEEMLGQNLEDAYTPESAAVISRGIKEAQLQLSQGKPIEMQRMELEQTCKDGSTIWTELSLSPVISPEGQFVCLLGDSRDISDRRGIERSLRESEDLHRSIVSASPDGIIITSLEGLISYVSPAALRLFGYEHPEDLQNRPFSDFLFEEDRSKIQRNNQLMILGLHRGVGEYRIYHKGGGVFFNEVNAEVIHGADTQPIGLVYVIRDITKRKLLEQAEIRARRMAEALQQAGMAINSTLDYKEMLSLILEQVVHVIQCDMGSVLIRDEEKIQLTATHGYANASELIGLRFSLLAGDALESPNRLVFEQERPVIVGDVLTSYPTFIMHGLTIRSWMGIPLFSRNVIIGFLNLDSHELNHFTAEDQRIAETFGNQVSIALENARLYQDAQRRIQDLSILNDVIQSVIASSNMDTLMVRVYQQVSRFIDSRLFMIAEYNREPDEWHSVILMDHDQKKESIRYSTSEGFAGYVIQTRQPLFLKNVHEVEQFIQDSGRCGVLSLPRSLMIVPLLVADEVVGVMGAQNDEVDDTYTAEDFMLFGSIGKQVSVALENTRLYARMEQLAITDSLTEIYNRRYFFTTAETELARAQRYHNPLSVIMVDIDHFKRVNDTYGHAAGDVVLKSVAQMTSRHLRKVDLLGRYGGEEFVMMLPETGKTEALILASRLLQIIATHEFKTVNASISITASMGVSELEGSQDTLEAMLERADQALYAAKLAGRNQVK